jgi:hypothetical protein
MARAAHTRHENASQPPTTADRERLRTLRDQRALPAPGASLSSDMMLEALTRIIDTGQGLRYEVDKLTQWAKRFPTRDSLTQIQPWRTWPAGRTRAIADAVMLGGDTATAMATVYGTTRETVEDIVKAARAEIRRTANG